MLPQRRSIMAARTAAQVAAVLLACVAPGVAIGQEAAPAAPPGPKPAGPLKVLSWNVATSPYAIAMRKIKSAAPSWRTSFGSERRSINPPAAPQAADFDFDVVLLQGVINPRALRRLFPARKWRLVLSTRALSSLPRGSVFTAPVSTTEVEAVAVRYRQGMRIATRTDVAGAAPAPIVPDTGPGVASGATAPGVAVKVIDRGRTLWFASIALDAACATESGPCPEWDLMTRWRLERRAAGEGAVSGGRLTAQPETPACARQSIEAELPLSASQPQLAKGQSRDLLGCVAELTID